jgi:hypothetical protein
MEAYWAASISMISTSILKKYTSTIAAKVSGYL